MDDTSFLLILWSIWWHFRNLSPSNSYYFLNKLLKKFSTDIHLTVKCYRIFYSIDIQKIPILTTFEVCNIFRAAWALGQNLIEPKNNSTQVKHNWFIYTTSSQRSVVGNPQNRIIHNLELRIPYITILVLYCTTIRFWQPKSKC